MKLDIRPLIFALLASLLFVIILSGCSLQYHKNRMEYHKAKAIAKGAKIERDTLVTTISDTIIRIEKRNDTIFITKTLTKTVELAPEMIIQDRWQIKYKDRTELREDKQKTKRIEAEAEARIKEAEQATKKAKAENWGFWDFFGLIMFCFIFGLVVGFVAHLLLRSRS